LCDVPGRAEVALEVADAWQGLGVGTILLGQLAERAAARGIETFTALVLPENHAMIQVFRDSGFPAQVRAQSGVLAVELPTEIDAAARRRFHERDRVAAVAAVRHFLEPASIAVIGASERRGSVGAALVQNLRDSFSGPLFAVGRGQSIRDVDAAVELAVIAVPAAAVEAVARECAEHGVAALLVVSAGFEDAEGTALRRRLAAFCRATGMRMIGPNCLGVAGSRLNATFARSRPYDGRVALLSQSGGVGIAALEQGRSHGIGLSSFVSIGDRADVSSNDLLQWWEQDDGTDVIALYLESFGNPRRFARIAKRVGPGKPIVAVKAGRSHAGSRAAGSHTGALVAASDAAVDALFAQAGVIRTDSYRELVDVTGLLARHPTPAGSRVGVVTNAGGPAILFADAADAAGLELAEFAPATLQALRALLPAAATPGNPVDALGDANAERLRDAIVAVGADPGIDAVAVVYVPTLVLDPDAAAAATAEAASRLDRRLTVVAVLLTGAEPPARLRAAGIPTYAFPEDAARALGAAARRTRALDRQDSPPAEVRPAPFRDEAAALLAGALASGLDWLEPDAVDQLARCYGLPFVSGRLTRTPAAAADAPAELGSAVALKAIGPGLLHKTDVGGLRGKSAVLRAARAMRADLRGAGLEPTGFLVQPMAEKGVELLVGVTHDPTFGPVVACAAGGTAAELLADASVRLAPLSERDIHEMPRALATFLLLAGHRGAPKADVAALEDVLRRVSALADDHAAIAELDCNPVVVTTSGAAIVDMRVRVHPAPPPAPLGALQGH
jgi:acyl-CoA synthetase (NDP forming)